MYEPNVWGLFDMHGNVSEWTLSAWRPYPYQEQDGRNNPDVQEKRVVRGGSWSDRPKRARSEFRLAYEPWQGVFNVGFRVALPCTEEESMLAAAH
jgi:formylglycine-generating enzyme required for sulfatase activity